MKHDHQGSPIGEGWVIVTEKHNKELKPIDGWWRVRLCQNCGEFFSNRKLGDCLDPYLSPKEGLTLEGGIDSNEYHRSIKRDLSAPFSMRFPLRPRESHDRKLFSGW